MATEQTQWAMQYREIPGIFRNALGEDEPAIRYRPAPGEWSAIEVVGHMVDKMRHWSRRVERVLKEEQPTLPGYDQDAEVREYDYQHADVNMLFEQLQQQCEHFATLIEAITTSELERKGIHEEVGNMTLRQCIEAPLKSVPEHLEQLKAAQNAYDSFS